MPLTKNSITQKCTVVQLHLKVIFFGLLCYSLIILQMEAIIKNINIYILHIYTWNDWFFIFFIASFMCSVKKEKLKVDIWVYIKTGNFKNFVFFSSRTGANMTPPVMIKLVFKIWNQKYSLKNYKNSRIVIKLVINSDFNNKKYKSLQVISPHLYIR